MATQLTVYPGLDPEGNSLTVYAEDGVTVIQPILGAVVYFTAYYQKLLATGQLLDYNPLSTSGTAVEIPPYEVVTGGQVGLTTVALGATPGLLEGLTLQTTGYAVAGDGGGAVWQFTTGLTANGFTIVSCPNGQWQMLVSATGLNIRAIGCTDDGATDCGAIINAYLAVVYARDGIDAYVCLTVPDIRRSAAGGFGGYRIATPIIGPEKMTVVIQGEGVRPFIDTFAPGTATSTARRSGAIFTVAPNIDAFGPVPGSQYTYLRLENIGILGPGSHLTTGSAIQAHSVSGNFDLATSNVLIGGFQRGLYLRNAISGHGHWKLKVFGCGEGLTMGLVSDGVGPFENSFYDIDVQLNLTGIRVLTAQNNRFVNGLVQGNRNGIHFGDSLGTGTVSSFTMAPLPHFEGNGDDNSYWLNNAPGGKGVLVESAPGNAYTQIVFSNGIQAGTIPGGVGGSMNVSIPLGQWVFRDVQMGGSLTVASGAEVSNEGRGATGGFTSVVLDQFSDYKAPRDGLVKTIINWTAPGGTTYTHNWANGGRQVFIQLDGPGTLNAPTNAPIGERCTFLFVQGTPAGHALTIGTGIRLDPDRGAWSNTGNGVAAATATLELVYRGNGIWVEVSRSRWSS